MIFFMVEKMQMFKIFLVMSVKISYAVVKNYHTVVKIGNDNTPKDPARARDGSSPEEGADPFLFFYYYNNKKIKKHNYTKVIIEDPYANREIIARVAKKQKGVYV
jgi:hypothetical protein